MRITRHASERMRERNITTAMVNTAIQFGKHMVNKHDSSKITVVDNALNIYVVMDKSGNVITVFTKER